MIYLPEDPSDSDSETTNQLLSEWDKTNDDIQHNELSENFNSSDQSSLVLTIENLDELFNEIESIIHESDDDVESFSTFQHNLFRTFLTAPAKSSRIDQFVPHHRSQSDNHNEVNRRINNISPHQFIPRDYNKQNFGNYNAKNVNSMQDKDLSQRQLPNSRRVRIIENGEPSPQQNMAYKDAQLQPRLQNSNLQRMRPEGFLSHEIPPADRKKFGPSSSVRHVNQLPPDYRLIGVPSRIYKKLEERRMADKMKMPRHVKEPNSYSKYQTTEMPSKNWLMPETALSSTSHLKQSQEKENVFEEVKIYDRLPNQGQFVVRTIVSSTPRDLSEKTVSPTYRNQEIIGRDVSSIDDRNPTDQSSQPTLQKIIKFYSFDDRKALDETTENILRNEIREREGISKSEDERRSGSRERNFFSFDDASGSHRVDHELSNTINRKGCLKRYRHTSDPMANLSSNISDGSRNYFHLRHYTKPECRRDYFKNYHKGIATSLVRHGQNRDLWQSSSRDSCLCCCCYESKLTRTPYLASSFKQGHCQNRSSSFDKKCLCHLCSIHGAPSKVRRWQMPRYQNRWDCRGGCCTYCNSVCRRKL